MSNKNENKKQVEHYWHKTPGQGPVPVSPRVNFGELDHKVLELWKERNIRERTVSERQDCPDYVTYDGPPGTNGEPHIGHMLQSALKDLWPKYYTMKGYRVLRKAGWDTHGLPIELTAEKELGLKCKRDILDYGVEKYIDYCRKTVFRYKDAWTNAIHRIGRFLDTDNYYATLHQEYIQTDWWVLKQAWDKGLLYKGHKIMPYCSRCGTSLSAHETAQGYEDVTDISLYVKFPIEGQKNTYFIAWTTTAWTLLSNVALAVNPDLQYVTIDNGKERYILAETCLEALREMLSDFRIIEKRVGRELEGIRYKPLWDFQNRTDGTAHYVIIDEYVTAEDGSGVVHLALYGEDDFRLIQANNLPMVQNVDADGNCIGLTDQFAGRHFSDPELDIDILKDIAAKDLLLGKEKITHSYPFCYRCDARLMYFAKSCWFLRTSSFKDRMLKANEDINWYPAYIKNGRFGNWLENNVDWAISRERYWGSPLPIWTCRKCGHRECVGSLAELAELNGKPLPKDFDPHKPYIDRFELPCSECGGSMQREPEVLDSWFNAGIMPWGQWGYPSVEGSDEVFENQYPADYICEAIDQTRGWFYTMLAISTMLTDKSSFKNVICSALISDDTGRKMSKSRGNVVDPIHLCEKYGADAVRLNFYVINPWMARRFNEKDVAEGLKQVIIPYWNAYSFFVTYARVDNWKPVADTKPSGHILDCWIMSRLEWLREKVEVALDNYDVTTAAGAITTFIDELTNWYIRRSRRRFWKSEDDQDKASAYATLFRVITNLNRMLAPFMPFVSEVVFQNLERAYSSDKTDSVHLSEWLAPNPEARDIDLEQSMAITRNIVSIARSLRNEGGVRVRQPLSEIVVSGNGNKLGSELEALILDELNMKKLRYTEDQDELFSYGSKADFKQLGPRLGKRIKEISSAIADLDDASIRNFISTGSIQIEGEKIEKDDIIIEQIPKEGFWVRSDGALTIAVDNHIDKQLRSEWLAREFVHHVQNLRKEADLEVTQRINIQFKSSAEITDSVKEHTVYIMNETLALSLKDNTDLTAGSGFEVGNQSIRMVINTV
ncbi:isoleucine--tRNA ligase [bacterium]|nr:isoleucine--tRNA ligase [bacterium]